MNAIAGVQSPGWDRGHHRYRATPRDRKEKQIPRSARNDNPVNLLRQIGIGIAEIAEIADIARQRRERKILPLITRISLIYGDRKNILRQTGTDHSIYDQEEIFKLKFTCIFL
jgi:hypothetical protein